MFCEKPILESYITKYFVKYLMNNKYLKKELIMRLDSLLITNGFCLRHFKSIFVFQIVICLNLNDCPYNIRYNVLFY